MIVVDTNAVIALVLDTDATADARTWRRRDSDWHAPTLLLSELRNVLIGEVRRGNLELAGAAEVAEVIAEQINWLPPVASGEVLAAASSGGLSAYDAEFVAAARQHDVPLLTNDRAILRAFPGLAVSLRQPPEP